MGEPGVWEVWGLCGETGSPTVTSFSFSMGRKPEREDPTQKTFVPNLPHFRPYCVLKSHTGVIEYLTESLRG